MNKIVATLLGCIFGAGIGGLTGYKLAQKKYYKLADKEVAQVRAHYEKIVAEHRKTIQDLCYANKQITKGFDIKIDEKQLEPKKKETKGKKKLPDNQVSSIKKPDEEDVKKQYVDYTKMYKTESKEERTEPEEVRPDLLKEAKTENNPIEIIAPEEYGDHFYNYFKDTLYYYSDGVLADEQDNPIIDIANTVGNEALFSFGRYEEDRVCVRNHLKEQDYEIILCLRDFKKEPAGANVGPEDE